MEYNNIAGEVNLSRAKIHKSFKQRMHKSKEDNEAKKAKDYSRYIEKKNQVKRSEHL